MKQQSCSKPTKPTLKDSTRGNNGYKKASSKGTHKPGCDSSQMFPFIGKIFYLDISNNKRSQALEKDIKKLGGTVEKFFSKEIRYLVSSRPEARFARHLAQDSPVPSPDSGLSSPCPASRRSSSQDPTDVAVASRGKSLVEKVVKSQEHIKMNRMLTTALEWGVKVLHVDDVISHIERKKTILVAQVKASASTIKKTVKPEPTEKAPFQKLNAGRISRPFIKVEDSSRHYKPLYLPMASLPVCSYKSLPPCCPFAVQESGQDGQGKKQREQRSGEERPRDRKGKSRKPDGREKKKGGYCECCGVKYDSLKAHLQSEQHHAFSKSKEYLVVDGVIEELSCDLIQITAPSKRTKCSISTILHTPVPAERNEQVDAEGERMLEETLLWAATGDHQVPDSVERSIDQPHFLRKRCREPFSWSQGDSSMERLENSQSKRGLCEPESSPSLGKALGQSLQASVILDSSLDAQDRNQRLCLRDQTRYRTQKETHSGEHSQRKFGSLITTESQWLAKSQWDVETTKALCQQTIDLRCSCRNQTTPIPVPSLTSEMVSQTARLRCVSQPEPYSTAKPVSPTHCGPIGIEKPLPGTEDGPIIADQPLNKADQEPVCRCSPPFGPTSWRKVRNFRRKRKARAPNLSEKLRHSRTVQISERQINECPDLSVSTLDLWHLFQTSSSDGALEEFKGFQG